MVLTPSIQLFEDYINSAGEATVGVTLVNVEDGAFLLTYEMANDEVTLGGEETSYGRFAIDKAGNDLTGVSVRCVGQGKDPLQQARQ